MDFQINRIISPGFEGKEASFWQSHKKLIIIGSILVIMVILGMFLFFVLKSFSESQVSFKIEGPTEVSSGDLATYKVSYENNSKTKLTDIKLLFLYPENSIAIKNEKIIKKLSNQNVDLPDLDSGQSNNLDFGAFIVGNRGDVRTVRAELVFKATNINSVFRKQQSLATTITSLPIPITISAPPTILNGQKLNYIIDYRNESGSQLSGLKIKVKYPSGFKFVSSNPSPSENQDGWNLGGLEAGLGSRISIQGDIFGAEREEKMISVSIQKPIDTPNGQVFIDLERLDVASIIAGAFLEANLSLNDSSNYTAHLADDLNYKITLKNNADFDITAIKLNAKLDGSMFDLASLKSSGFLDSRSGTISWDQSSLPGLANLGVNQNLMTEFSVRLKSSFGSGIVVASNSFVKISVSAETQNVPPHIDLDKISAQDQIVTRITSAPTLDQSLALNDATLGKLGPFPPKVDSKTVFNVHWTLANPSNNLSPAKVTAILAPGVGWENKTRSSGTPIVPSYNQRTNIVTWDLGNIPTGTGSNFPKYETYFQISIRPSVNQADQAADLLKSIRFDSVDTSTKEKIVLTVRDTTSFSVSDSDQPGNVQ